MRFISLLLTGLLIGVAVILAAALALGAAAAIPVAVLVALCAGFVVFHRILEAVEARRGGGWRTRAADDRSALPQLPFDDATPLGATVEQRNDELLPQDLPRDHPQHRELARRRREQAMEEAGRRRG
jgi:hypothetical protein